MTAPKQHVQPDPIAALLAWVLPGLGYAYRGERLRAAYAFAGVAGLGAGGLLIGGVDVVDFKEDAGWTLVSFFAGPTMIAVDQYHRKALKPALNTWSRSPAPPPAPYTRSVGRVNETGMLFIALAGMANLIMIVDCAAPVRPRRDRGSAA